MKNRKKIWNFLNEQEPSLIGKPFGKFNIKVEKDFYFIEYELYTNLENPFTNTELKTCRVDKKYFKNWKNKQNSIIFY
jgi:hypothetical protein